ncbi:hypothetical protein EDB29_1011104 [Vibrio crassostreae]|uniref:hypothetical protein n=1 Tax=Vibrio crassostreae TaxID=246167 RepID=UPI00104D4792|nr:hypothetical protein [Vibrio crassostreae]CAH6851293.1 conserved hypothetical protein [Vibrio chagasii]TCT44292.1 hypothetical protein EDB29_1011104 [Vibrio crassostreae]CAH6862957.1 conserved hypothetical protein [Vibrio chagasii]CAH6928297.1 conserved hypothetical protein [Vibrio chagasii]CAH6947602.1 conserved hypothetical protein [Vibrio chagasii]
MLVKPKDVTLTTNINNVKEVRSLRIGRYPATKGMYMIGRVAEVLKQAMLTDAKGTYSFAKELQAVSIEVCEFCEIKTLDGEFMPLKGELIINAHIPDQDMLMLLMKEVHDYNTNFFNTGRLLKTSRSMMQKAKEQITKMSSRLLDSSSQRNKRPSKN